MRYPVVSVLTLVKVPYGLTSNGMCLYYMQGQYTIPTTWYEYRGKIGQYRYAHLISMQGNFGWYTYTHYLRSMQGNSWQALISVSMDPDSNYYELCKETNWIVVLTTNQLIEKNDRMSSPARVTSLTSENSLFKHASTSTCYGVRLALSLVDPEISCQA